MQPIVGQQVTLSAATATTATPRIALLMSRADAGDCELVAKGTTLAGHRLGFLYIGIDRDEDGVLDGDEEDAAATIAPRSPMSARFTDVHGSAEQGNGMANAATK